VLGEGLDASDREVEEVVVDGGENNGEAYMVEPDFIWLKPDEGDKTDCPEGIET
jgi:hypothetical protein